MKSKLSVKIPSKTIQQIDELIKHLKYPSIETFIVNIVDILYKHYEQQKKDENTLTMDKLKSAIEIMRNQSAIDYREGVNIW